jgi:hypothetical protein
MVDIFPNVSIAKHNPTCLLKTKLSIYQLGNVYGRDNSLNTDRRCPRCEFWPGYGELAQAELADVVIVNMQMTLPPIASSPILIGSYYESPDHYSFISKNRPLVDLVMGWNPALDDVYSPAMVYDTFKHYKRVLKFPLPSFHEKLKNKYLVAWISNCRLENSGRNRILANLAENNITVEQLGRCGRTATGTVTQINWREFSLMGDGENLVAQSTGYLFFYAAENSLASYYHTEKLFHAFLAGSVPVYVGNKTTLVALVPPNSVIFANDYPSTTELAQFLLSMVANQSHYESYLAWRVDSLFKPLQHLLRFGKWMQKNRHCVLCATALYYANGCKGVLK